MSGQTSDTQVQAATATIQTFATDLAADLGKIEALLIGVNVNNVPQADAEALSAAITNLGSVVTSLGTVASGGAIASTGTTSTG